MDQEVTMEASITEETTEPTQSQSVTPECATTLSLPANDSTPAPISKRQLKKQKKLLEYEAKRKLKRIQDREKARQKRMAAVARGEPARNGPSRKQLKLNKIEHSNNPIRVAVDLNFDDLMIDKDVCKCAKQLLWVYTINRKSKMPIQLYYTGMLKEGRIHKAIQRNEGHENWDVKTTHDLYTDVWPKHEIVYLTSDSDNVLDVLNPQDVYVIGGLVDHNHHKGLCHTRATELGLRHARLPLSENICIKTRTVLTIVHVFDILLRVSEGVSWKEAIMGVIPSRKGAVPLNEEDESKDENAETLEIEIKDAPETANNLEVDVLVEESPTVDAS